MWLGNALAASMNGTDLRTTMGSTFSVPRTPGQYPLVVCARDASGGIGWTTIVRLVTVN